MGQGPVVPGRCPIPLLPAGPRFRNAPLHHATISMGTVRRYGTGRTHRCDRSHQHQRADAPLRLGTPERVHCERSSKPSRRPSWTRRPASEASCSPGIGATWTPTCARRPRWTGTWRNSTSCWRRNVAAARRLGVPPASHRREARRARSHHRARFYGGARCRERAGEQRRGQGGHGLDPRRGRPHAGPRAGQPDRPDRGSAPNRAAQRGGAARCDGAGRRAQPGGRRIVERDDRERRAATAEILRLRDLAEEEAARSAEETVRAEDEAARAEEFAAQAEESRERLEAVLAGISDGFLVMDRDLTVLFVNPQGAEMLGRSAAELR